MKLKYKKVVLAVTMSTMCIGFVTISLTSPKANHTKPESETIAATTGSAIVAESTAESENYNLECDAYPEINEVIEKYLAATVTGDMDALESVVSDIDNVSEDMVKNKTQIIETQQNIQCYTVKVPNQDGYIVYVYSEMKLVGIDTAAPALTRLYVCMSSDGAYRVYISKLDEEIQEFMEKSQNSPQVQALIDKVNQAFEEAVNSDEKLKAFYQQIEDNTVATPEETPAAEASAAAEATPETTSEAGATPTETSATPAVTGTESTPTSTGTENTPAATGTESTPSAAGTENTEVMTTDLPAEETEAAYE